jgi:hypothetical protein
MAKIARLDAFGFLPQRSFSEGGIESGFFGEIHCRFRFKNLETSWKVFPLNIQICVQHNNLEYHFPEWSPA